jgi:VWFA-related protein
VLLLSLAGNFGYVRAQSAPEERPRLKDFGSSLKRLKWDRKKSATVETKPSAKSPNTEEDDVVRVETNLVACDVQVRDGRGNVVTGLTQTDFTVFEDGQPQQIRHFSLGSDRSVGRSIVLLIDYSGSQLPYIRSSVEAAKMLVDQLGPTDLMAIITDDVALLVDFTRDRQKLKKALDSLRKKSEANKLGRSKQFSALMATVREMFNAEDIRPIVIFQTDGDEVFSLRTSTPPVLSIPAAPNLPAYEYGRQAEFSLRDVYLAVEKSRSSVYTVIPGRQRIQARTEKELAVPPVKAQEFAVEYHLFWGNVAAAGAAIGGWTAYFDKPEDAGNIYSKILADINSRYVVGYYPTNRVHDGKRRKVLVEVRDHPDYSIQGRKSYIAQDPEP